MIHQLTIIQQRLSQTAAWRAGQCTARYPHDDRNAPAAALLQAIADEDPSGVREGTFDAIQPHLKTKTFDDLVNATAREVGFRHRPKNLNGFLVILADKLDAAGGAL